MKNENYRMKAIMLIALLAVAVLPSQLFAQSAATLGGRVMDSSQAVIPGAEVTAFNVDTGVETRTTTNNAGVYNFPNLQSGTYRITARAAGFTEKTVTDARLRVGASTVNFEMLVAGSVTSIDVSGVAESMLLEAGSSSGTVMQEQLVSELPLVGSNVMELLNSMGGVIKAEEPVFGASNQSFGGISGGSINVTRDGVSASDLRYNSGVVGSSYLNQELVGEFKMILSPVDAELGRGAGQVQVTTKSGGNEYHGSGVWNIQNTALDARKFEDKRQGLTPPWRNVNNYTLSVSGPIIKNRTFFFASWDQQIVRSKEWRISAALTECAKKGIYRYYDGVVSVNPVQAITNDYRLYDGTNYPRRQTVVSTEDGRPQLTNQPAGTTGQLYHQSLFGDRLPTDLDATCSQYTLPTAGPSAFPTPLDPARNKYDTTGYISKFLGLMPTTNYFGTGDGLNTAGIRWWRTSKGNYNIYGQGEDGRRKQFTVKIDHNINSEHRLSGTYTIERSEGEDGGVAWPENSYIGTNLRRPQTLNLTLMSTLKPTLLNEFRLGYSRIPSYVMSTPESNEELEPLLNEMMSGIDFRNYKTVDGFPVVISYDDANLNFGPRIDGMGANPPISAPWSSRGGANVTWGGKDTRWTFADNITWINGAHSFKGGVEFRNNNAYYDQQGGMSYTFPVPSIRGGDMQPVINFADPSWNLPGIRPFTDRTGTVYPGLYSSNTDNRSSQGQGPIVADMLNFLAGGVQFIKQNFYIVKDGGNYRWSNYKDGETRYINDLRSREFSFFFKDDWKITRDLSLNLGVRYEYYGVPWNDTGLTVGLEGGSNAILGNSGAAGSSPWMKWMDMSYTDKSTRYEFVGPNSEHSDRRQWNRDLNNFAPHVGFSYQLPWWGKGLTTLRGGYSISYLPINNFDNYIGVMARVSGTTYDYQYNITATQGANESGVVGGYTTLANVSQIFGGAQGDLMIPPVGVMEPFKYMSGGLTVYDENIKNPYSQSLNLSLTRQLGKAFTLDVRYIGNLTRNQLSSVALNTPNYMSNGLFKEFEAVRYQGATTPNSQIPTLIDVLGPTAATMMTTGPNGFQNAVDYATSFAQLAQGNYNALAANLARYGSLGAGISGPNIGGAASTLEPTHILANPQLSNAGITTNLGYSNYHSLQAQVTMRPVRGLSFQTTYTWSRSITDRGILNYDTGTRRYYLSDQHRSHSLTSYGSYELPFGARGFLFRDASGAFKKAIEGWGLSWVANISSGLPMSFGGAGSSYWGVSDAVVERPDLWDNKAGKVEYFWKPDGTWDHATFYGDKYVKVVDPICATITLELQSNCSQNRRALALASDPSVIVIRNAAPGEIGNLMPNSLTGPGRWNLDMAMSKSVEFMEGKRIEFRLDAANIFNHATPSGTADTWNHAPRFDVISLPQVNLNNTTQVGYIATKSGHRTFQGKLSIRF